MTDIKNAIQFIVIPENGSRTYTFRLRRGIIYFVMVVFILLAALFGYMLVVHQGLFSKALRASRLEKENTILRTQALKIAELEAELGRLNTVRQHLYELAGVTAESPQGGRGDEPDDELILLPREAAGQTSPASAAGLLATATSLDTSGAEGSSIPSLWPVRGWVTAEFGEELPGKDARHQGIDIAAPQGTAILSSASGLITMAGWDKNLGLIAVVDHQNGLCTLYGHCSQVLVQVGDEITQGQVIAYLGNTGKSSAPHLHFEIRENGKPVDPRGYLGP